MIINIIWIQNMDKHSHPKAANHAAIDPFDTQFGVHLFLKTATSVTATVTEPTRQFLTFGAAKRFTASGSQHSECFWAKFSILPIHLVRCFCLWALIIYYSLQPLNPYMMKTIINTLKLPDDTYSCITSLLSKTVHLHI